jgi:hypothetical protein
MVIQLTEPKVRTGDGRTVTITSQTPNGNVVTIGLVCLDIDDQMVTRLIGLARGFDRICDVRHGTHGETFVVDVDVQYIEPDQIDQYVETTLNHLTRAFERALAAQRPTTDVPDESAATSSAGRTTRDRGDRTGRGRRVSHR